MTSACLEELAFPRMKGGGLEMWRGGGLEARHAGLCAAGGLSCLALVGCRLAALLPSHQGQERHEMPSCLLDVPAGHTQHATSAPRPINYPFSSSRECGPIPPPPPLKSQRKSTRTPSKGASCTAICPSRYFMCISLERSPVHGKRPLRAECWAGGEGDSTLQFGACGSRQDLGESHSARKRPYVRHMNYTLNKAIRDGMTPGRDLQGMGGSRGGASTCCFCHNVSRAFRATHSTTPFTGTPSAACIDCTLPTVGAPTTPLWRVLCRCARSQRSQR